MTAAFVSAATVAGDPSPTIIWSGLVDINVPSTLAGVYINVVTGEAGGLDDSSAPFDDVPGWDVNLYTSPLQLFSEGGNGYVAGGDGGVGNLAFGELVGSDRSYIAFGRLEGSVLDSDSNLVGFRFLNEDTGEIHYGWLRISLSSGGGPRSVVEYAYESQPGVPIPAGERGAGQVLSLTTQPSVSSESGVVFPRQPVVQIIDLYGDAVASPDVVVTASIASGGGTLGGTTTVTTDANGVATFTDLSIAGAAGDRTLLFSADGMDGVVSEGITVTACLAPRVAVNSQRVSAAVGSSAVMVTASCAWVTTSNAAWLTVEAGASGVGDGEIVFSFSDNTGSTSRLGTISVVTAAGVATVEVEQIGTGLTAG